MAESEIKQVTVALSHPDELNPRRRRRTRKFKDDMDSQVGGAAPVGAVDATGSPQPPQQTVTVQKQDLPVQTTTVSATPGATPVHSTSPVQNVTPVQPTPSLAATPMVGGSAVATTPGAVHILEKKNASGSRAVPGGLNAPNAPVASAPAPKIVPHKKRLTSAPVAQTLKKPKFVVSGGAAPPAASEKPTPLPAPKNATISGGVGIGGVDLKPVKGGGGGLKQRRRFTERRIKIEVKPTVKTRKSRKVLKERIDAMPIQAVRRLLIKKGILKPKATAPPEPMMRSMLHDYYLLKQSE